MKILRLFLLVSVLGLFSGCTGGNFLVGKWAFDRERTLEEITGSTAGGQETQEDSGGGLLRGIVGGLQKGLSMVVVSQMEGLELQFTRTDVRRIRHGSGESQGYRIIERVSPDTYLVEYDDGEIVTWARTDSGIRMKLGAEEEVWVHFRPADGK